MYTIEKTLSAIEIIKEEDANKVAQANSKTMEAIARPRAKQLRKNLDESRPRGIIHRRVAPQGKADPALFVRGCGIC